MKKTFFIVSGVLIIFFVGAVWAYLFTYGTPKNTEELFATFGLGGETVTPTVIPNTTIVDVGAQTSDGSPQRLKQLTTRPIAGMHSDGSVVQYVEQGTGHIYQIDLKTGAETLLRGTTIPQTTKALFSPQGTYVILTTYTGLGEKVIIDTLKTSDTQTNNSQGLTLPNGATELGFGSNPSLLFYTIHDTSGTVGYSYDITKAISTKLFTLPLRDIRILWGETLYAYTTPTETGLGYLYAIKGGRLQPLVRNETALMGTRVADTVAVTSLHSDTFSSRTLAADGDTDKVVPITLIPEKCVSSPSNVTILYCGSPETIPNNFPDNWYKGVVSLTDVLWEVNVVKGEAKVLSNFTLESGREVDIASISTAGAYIFFVNKNDNTLWLFDGGL